MQKEAERLNNLAESANNKYNDYSGDNEKYKNQLKSTYETAKKKADDYSQSLSEIEKYLNEYINVTFNELPNAVEEWQSLQNAISETRAEIIQATIDAGNLKFEIGAKKFEAEVKQISNAIELIDKQLEYATGSNKDRLFQDKINLLKQQQVELHNLANQYRASAQVIANYLKTVGFIFESDGSIGNIQHLESLKGSDVYEEINEQLEKYLELTQDTIPALSVEWWNLQEAIDDTRISILEAKDELSDIVLDVNVSKLNQALDKIRNEISRIEREIDKAFGSAKEGLLQDKISALRQEQNELHNLANAYRQQKQEIANFLNTQGFNFDSSGNIANGENILNFKDDPAMMTYLQGLIDKYENLGSTINGLSQDWWVLQDSIDDAKEEIENARKELAKFLEEAKVEALVDRFNDLSHTLDLIDKKLEHATGTDKLNLLSQKLELIKEQQIEINKQWDYFNSKKKELQSQLSLLGFTFDSDGDITNYVSQLEQIANSSMDFEEVKETLEEYFNIQNEELPNLESSWQDFENAYKDVLKEQLNITKDIEDKITDMYKKQVEDRIDAMNKETDAKIKALKKQQDAYNAYRDEVDYQEEYDEKLQEITDLQKQLDIAMKDSSLNGQKKVQELQEQIAQAQKELQKLTQEKIDQNINDMFDKEAERIEEENQQNIEELENQWSDSKIAEMVAQALGSGVFTDIEGNVSSLEDALVNFADETGELFGVLGTVIKSELITNLEIAKDTVSSLASIMQGLDLGAYMSTQDISGIGDVSSRMATSNSYSNINTNNQISITAPIINIEGNVDNSVVDELKSISNQIKEQVIDAIAGSIR